jgi:WD40 repeat protein
VQTFDLPKPKATERNRAFSPDVMPEALAFSPDGQLLAAWNRGGVYVIDTATGTVRTLWADRDRGLINVPGVGFTADGKAVVAHHNVRPPGVWVHDIATGKVVRKLCVNRFDAVEPSPGGRLVYIGNRPEPGWSEIVPWDPLTGKTRLAFARQKGSVRRLAVSADEKWIAGAGKAVAHIWSLSDPTQPARATKRFGMESYGEIAALAVSHDGALVAATGIGVGVRVWDVETGDEWQAAPYPSQYAREIAFHPSRPILALGGNSREVAFWDTTSRTELKRFAWEWPEPAGTSLGYDVDRVLASCFSPDGLRCATAVAGQVVVWDVDV